MSPLILLMLALVGAVLVQAFIRVVVAPRHRWVAVGRPRIAMARRTANAGRVERSAEIGEWENEGGSVAVASGWDAPRPGPRLADSGDAGHVEAVASKVV
jgi:hypothetical protein